VNEQRVGPVRLTISAKPELRLSHSTQPDASVGPWRIYNTTLGLRIKCQYFNDFGACLELSLTDSMAAPARAYDPPASRREQALATDGGLVLPRGVQGLVGASTRADNWA
jgi:hypothetical protein